VDHHSAADPVSRHGHVYVLSLALEDVQQNGSTEVAERGTLPASQHGGHEATVTRERQMANGVYAPVHRSQTPPLHPPFDRVQAHTQRHELGAFRHPVLPPRQLADPPIRVVRAELPGHTTGKSANPQIHPLNARRSPRAGRAARGSAAAPE